MGSRNPILLGLALTFVLVTQPEHIQADNKGTCRTGCQGSSHTFKYAEGTTYAYNYEGKIDFTLSSAEGQVVTTDVKAQVFLTQTSGCNQILRLKNVQVLGPNGKKYGTIPDVEKPIRLNFNDGRLEDSICIEHGDNQNSINLKRAIASFFQADLKHNYETDIFGLCPTDISTSQEGGHLVIHKTRHLNKCAYRETFKQEFLTTTFNLNSEIKSSPILSGDYNAVLKLKNGILDQATITEHYLYMPFSIGDKGAKANVVSKLHLTGQSKENKKAAVSEPRSIIFESPHPMNSPKSNVNTILNAIKETAKTIDVTVSENTAKEFVNLIKVLRVSNKDDILAVYNQIKSGAGVKDKEAAKKIFLDALLRAANGNTVEVALALLKNKELSPLEQKIVYIGLSLVQHSSEAAVAAATELLSQPNLPREAYLGIGNLAGRFCQQHSCENVDSINKLTQVLAQKLNGKPNNRKDENDVIFALKALTNVRHLNDNILAKITTIAQDKHAPARLRVVALETFLADPCKDKLRDSALGILKDIQQDSEIRIKAYLALAQCPNAKVGNAVKAMLEKEPSYQVGGFIASHIRNIRASANPDKDLAKQFLGFSIPKKFPIDFRKWSYNGEFSYAIDTLGLASSVETNIIYSQKSFLPRNLHLNLTTELFGHTFNFLEFNTRQENLDKLIEHYFGPKGVIRSTSLTDLWKNNEKEAIHFSDHLNKKLKDVLRARRDVSKSELDSIAKKIQTRSNELNNDLDLDYSLKVFGSELLFINVNDDVQKWKPEAIIDKLIGEFAKGLDKIKNFEETLRSNLMFMEAEFNYPTSLGFPLVLSVEGTSNIQLKTKGSIDVRALENNKDTTIKLSLIPSANIEVAGRFSLDAYVVENGFKLASTLYSATGGDVIIDLFNQGNGIDVKFSLPVKEQKIISASHEILQHTRELGNREENTPLKFAQPKDFSVCVDQLSQFIGLSFCAEINGPNLSGKQAPTLPFPLAGDAKVAVTIEKDDVKEYHFRSVVNNNGGELNLESIGNNGQKKVSLEVKAAVRPEAYITANLVTPIKQASAQGRIINNNNEKSLFVKLKNDNEEYSGKLGVQISGSPAKAIYKPILEVKTPSGPQKLPYNIDGQLIVEQNGQNVKYTFDNVKAVISNNKVISIKGNLGRESQAFFSDITVADEANSVSLKGRLQASANLLKFNAEVQNTFNPNANFNIKGEFKKQPDQFDSSLQVIHGQDLSSKVNILSITHSFTKKYKNPHDFQLATKNKVSYPLLGIQGKFEYEQTPKSLDYDLDVQYNEVKLGSELDLKYNQKEIGDYQLEFELWGLDNRVELKSSRHVQNDESKIDNSLVVNGKKAEVSGKIKHHVKPTNVDVGVDLIINLPTHTTPFKVSNALKWTPTDIDAFQKVLSGNTPIVDAFLKANKAGNANGSIKVNIKSVLNVNGQLKANKGTGNADILIDLESVKRQIKAESTFAVQPPNTYNVEVTIYPSFNVKKDQKIVLKTNNKVTETSIDSKNLIDIINHKLEVNVKGTKVGHLRSDGKLNGDIEVILPNEYYLLAKADVTRSFLNNVLNLDSVMSIEARKNKNTAGRKLVYSNKYKNTNFVEHNWDIHHTLSADNGDGKSLALDIIGKNQKKGETHEYNYEAKLSGSVLSHPWENVIKGHCDKKTGKYEGHSTYGPNSAFKVKGSYDIEGHAKPISGDINFEIMSPSQNLKTLKFSASGSAKKPHQPNDYLELQGSASIFADDNGSTPDATVDLKLDGSLKANEHDGQVSGTVKVAKHDPATLKLGYNRKESKDAREFSGNVMFVYGPKKVNSIVNVNVNKAKGLHYKLSATLDLPTEQYKNNKLTYECKRTEDKQHHTHHMELTSDGKTWLGDAEYTLSPVSPVINIKVKDPEGKMTIILYKRNKISANHITGEYKIVHEPSNFLLEGDSDINVESPDSFLIKLNIHSPSLKLNFIKMELQSKPGKSGRRIQINATENGKNLLSGSTSYTTREENGKNIIEGSGSVKVKEQSKTANFKYISQQLTLEKNGEEGIEISLDARLGNEAIDTELKITNKQFRYLNSYCEEKKDCAHIEIDSKTNADDLMHYNNEVEVAFDLRKLGLSYEFGLKAVTTRKEYVLDHTVDVHFQNKENNKYKYSLYLHPREAGVSLTTPKRIVSLESKTELPKNLKEGGKGSTEVVFYMDKKNHPEKKVVLTGWIDYDIKSKKINSEVKFIHPALARPLSHTVKTHSNGNHQKGEHEIVSELDIFPQANKKITTSYKIINEIDPKVKSFIQQRLSLKSPGLGIDVGMNEDVKVDHQHYGIEYNFVTKTNIGNSKTDNALIWKFAKTHSEFLLKVLNTEILKINNKYNINKQEQIIDSEISSYNKKPIVQHLEIKNLNTLKYNVGTKDGSKKVQFTSGFIPSQIADTRADLLEGGNKQNIFHGTIKLDDANFLKSDYGVDSKVIEKLAKISKDALKEYVEGLKHVGKEWVNEVQKDSKHVQKSVKESLPDFKPIKKYYHDEAEKIKEELLADKTIKEISEHLRNILQVTIKTYTQIFEKVAAIIEDIFKALENSFSKIAHAIEKDLIPHLQEVAEKLLSASADILNTTVEIALTYLTKISQVLEKFQPEFKQIAAALGEVNQDVARLALRLYENTKAVLTEQFNKIYHEIKALPVFEELKMQYNEMIKNGLPNADRILNAVKEVAALIKDAIPDQIPEANELVDLVVNYIEKKLKNQPVDDLEVLNKIFNSIANVAKKILSVIRSESSLDFNKQTTLPSLNFFTKLPKLVAAKFSPLSHFYREEAEAVVQFVLSLYTKPRYWFAPFPLFGMVTQGQHLFTFDGKHITLPGKCNYVLARDAVNGNFSIVGSYNNGFLTSITLADKQDSLTIKKGGHVLLNNAPTELPARKENIAAYRTYVIISLKSTAGVEVGCTADLMICKVKISGFYHGRTLGLLGNGNNEPYDDYTLPSGEIVLGESEFANAYKTTPDCANVNVPDHKHQDNPTCNKLFGMDSPLVLCYPFINPANFKMACAHGLSAGVKDTELWIARTYAGFCWERNIPVHVPTEYLKCSDGDQSFSYGDKFSVKTPTKMADIVLLVDTVKKNEAVYKELVQPLVQDISKELHNKGINDVDFHLVTYGGENHWPSHVTVGGKLTFKGKAPNLKFTEEPKNDVFDSPSFVKFHYPITVIRSLIHDLKLAFGLDLQAQTYREGLNYPFRTHAAKTIIAVTSEPCEVGKFYPLQKLRTLFYRHDLIKLNLITPFEGLTVKDSKKTKDVVGFNNYNVFTISQAKKKPEGSSELYKDLQYHDYCVDFTVKNNGNVFVSDNFVNAKADGKKQFIQVAAHNIVDQLTNVEEGIDCECQLINPYDTSNVCHTVHSKEKKKGGAKA